ncbi:MAG: hypothetical protein ABIA91_02720 [Patescibacteria group bacterium]
MADINEQSKIVNPFISVEKIKPDLRKKDPPLVDVKVSNPITYIKSWWKRVVGNEGMEIRIKIKPLTAILITVIVVTLCLGITRVVLPFEIPFLEFNSEVTPTPVVYRQTAFAGILRFTESNEKYFLETNSAEAINLEIPENISLDKFIGSRIFATGQYSDSERVLIVSDVSDLEIFPEIEIPIPTVKPTSIPVITNSPEPTITPTEVPTATSVPTQEPKITPTSSSITN